MLNFWRKYPELRTVIVNLKTGTSFRGVIWQRRADYLILKNAFQMIENDIRKSLDGEVLVLMADVEFIQVT